MDSLERMAALTGEDLWRAFEEQCQAAEATQATLLREILQANRDSEWGRRFGFVELGNVDHYRARVPLSDWDDYQEASRRMLAGEQDILVQGMPPVHFVKTTGTTGESKMLPDNRWSKLAGSITMSLRQQAVLRDHPEAFRGKILPLVNQGIIGETPGGVPYGYISGATLQEMSPAARARLAIPLALANIPPGEVADYCFMRFAIEHSVTLIAGNNALRLAQLFQLADRRREEILRDVEQGTLSEASAITEDLAPLMKPNPDRAQQLRALLTEHGKLTGYWPDLRLVLCWKSASMGSMVKEAAPWCPPQTLFREYGYGASEGKFTVPIDDQRAGGVLAPHGMFYEFLPEGESEKTLLMHQLEVGQCYEMILTNCMGLYRYRLHDMVRVLDRLGSAPIVAFERKSGDMGNMFGEKLTPADAAEVMAQLEGVRFYQLIARPEEQRYLVALELEAGSSQRPSARRVEQLLYDQNVAYRVFRDQLVLQPLKLQIMPPGWRDQLLAEMGRRSGGALNQIKLQVFPHRLIQGDNP